MPPLNRVGTCGLDALNTDLDVIKTGGFELD
jgi:hypothetical protein